MKPFFLYMLRCADGSYYVGHTDDLEGRLAQHQEGSVAGYTATRRPVALVYSCEFETRDEAFEREMQVKGWSRAKKEALIRGDWAKLPELSRPRSDPGASPPLVLRQAQHERESHARAIQGDLATLPELSRSRTGPGSLPPLVLRQAQHERVHDEGAQITDARVHDEGAQITDARVHDEGAQITDAGVPDEDAQITDVGGGRGPDA